MCLKYIFFSLKIYYSYLFSVPTYLFSVTFLLYPHWKHFYIWVTWQKAVRKHDCFSVSLRAFVKIVFPLYMMKCVNLYSLYFIYLVFAGHDHCLWHLSVQERWKCNPQYQQKLVSCFSQVRGSIPWKAG